MKKTIIMLLEIASVAGIIYAGMRDLDNEVRILREIRESGDKSEFVSAYRSSKKMVRERYVEVYGKKHEQMLDSLMRDAEAESAWNY